MQSTDPGIFPWPLWGRRAPGRRGANASSLRAPQKSRSSVGSLPPVVEDSTALPVKYNMPQPWQQAMSIRIRFGELSKQHPPFLITHVGQNFTPAHLRCSIPCHTPSHMYFFLHFSSKSRCSFSTPRRAAYHLLKTSTNNNRPGQVPLETTKVHPKSTKAHNSVHFWRSNFNRRKHGLHLHLST